MHWGNNIAIIYNLLEQFRINRIFCQNKVLLINFIQLLWRFISFKYFGVPLGLADFKLFLFLKKNLFCFLAFIIVFHTFSFGSSLYFPLIDWLILIDNHFHNIFVSFFFSLFQIFFFICVRVNDWRDKLTSTL